MAKLAPLRQNCGISVVIPARNETDTLRRAVASIQAQTYSVDEIVIAAADAATRSVANELARAASPPIRVLDNPDGGTASALNRAMQHATGDVLVRVDGHSQLPPNYVEHALATLRATRAANVGGKQVPQADDGFGRAVAIAMRSRLGSGGALYRTSTQPGPADTVYLGVFRREAVDAVGGFDERFIRNQDAELNERLREHGYLVWYEPALAVSYRPRDTVARLARQYFSYGRWRRATARFHPQSLRVRQVAAPAVVAGLLLSAGASIALGSWLPLAVAWGAYGVAVVIAGWSLARRPIVGLQVAAALATMHFWWGIGFLVGPPRNRLQGRDADDEEVR